MTTLADIRDVANRLEGIIIETPLLTSLELDNRVGGRVLLKPECLQRTGSFKIRGLGRGQTLSANKEPHTGLDVRLLPSPVCLSLETVGVPGVLHEDVLRRDHEKGSALNEKSREGSRQIPKENSEFLKENTRFLQRTRLTAKAPLRHRREAFGAVVGQRAGLLQGSDLLCIVQVHFQIGHLFCQGIIYDILY